MEGGRFLSEEFLVVARKLRHELNSLDVIDREITRKRLLANLNKILSEPSELSDLDKANFRNSLDRSKR